MIKLIDKIVDQYAAYKRYKMTSLALSRLTRAELQDIGVSPADIDYIARRAAKNAIDAKDSLTNKHLGH